MPVITIRSLARPDDVTASSTRISETVAAAAHMAPHDVWIVWSRIAPGEYVVKGEAPNTQPNDAFPPLAEISSGAGRSTDVVEAMLKATAEAIAAELRVAPTNVRVIYAEVPVRRIYSRGRYQ